jgi:hypothetical protein
VLTKEHRQFADERFLTRTTPGKIQIQKYGNQSRERPAVLNCKNYGKPVGELHFIGPPRV